MKYIIVKSKRFGEVKVNLTEAINGKKVLISEALSKDDEQEIKKLLDKQIVKKVEDAVKKELSSSTSEKKIVEIVKNCLVQFVKALWTRRGSWKSAIKNDPN